MSGAANSNRMPSLPLKKNDAQSKFDSPLDIHFSRIVYKYREQGKTKSFHLALGVPREQSYVHTKLNMSHDFEEQQEKRYEKV